jgi:hypothetical protein
MKSLILTACILACTVGSAQAQRCPAGEDQFHNCLSMDSGMRARQEQWASGSLARSGRRASAPPLVTGTTPTLQGVRYRMNSRFGPVTFVHSRDGRTTTFTTADGRRGTYRDGRLVRAPR